MQQMPRWVPLPCSRVPGDMGDSAEPFHPDPELPVPLTALLSLQKKEDKKVVNGKAAEPEDVPGMWPRSAPPQPSSSLGLCLSEVLPTSPGCEKRAGPMPKEEELPETQTPSMGTPGGPKGLVGEGLQPR